MPPVGYIAYVDEAGDDGLKKIRTKTERGASEWMVMSAVVIKAAREPEALDWAKSIIRKFDQHQLTHIHFQKLDKSKKIIACSELAGRPLRIFALLSHKRNMQGYRNLHAEKAKVNRTAWFYCWMSKLLLERVTAYCGWRSKHDYGEQRTIRFEFSDRGGVNINDIRNYYHYIGDQSRLGLLFNDTFDLDWTVVDPDEMHIFPNKQRAGLQLADIAASAFFSGLEFSDDGTTNPEFAKLLLPRICRDRQRKIYGFGVKMMPVWVPNLPPGQSALREFYIKK